MRSPSKSMQIEERKALRANKQRRQKKKTVSERAEEARELGPGVQIEKWPRRRDSLLVGIAAHTYIGCCRYRLRIKHWIWQCACHW